MTFKEAIEAVPELAGAYCLGLQALGANAARITPRRPRDLTGSVDLDAALRATAPSEPRWDYGIGHGTASNEQVVWVEVHPANSSHVDAVLRKLSWLRRWLTEHAPNLSRMTAPEGGFVWLATGAIALPPTDPRRRRIAQQGLRLVGGRLVL